MVTLVLATFLAVTNHAGFVVSGVFGGVTNDTFVINARAYPLSILPKSEILRVKRAAGMDVRTGREKRHEYARKMRLERIRVREEEGLIDAATAQRRRSQIGP